MQNRIAPVCVALFAAVLFAALPPLSSSQSAGELASAYARTMDPCKDVGSQRAWDDATSPVYADATELARTFNDRGIEVECIRRSKEEHLFEGQKGAAWYKTNYGVLEVWFLSKAETFGALKIIQQAQANGWYLYSFRGKPRIPTKFESPKPISFIKRGHILFQVNGNKQLADTIETAFPQR